ncbi:hypothetical protein VSX64_14620 [Aurantimonas sp. C2-6-R+9]|uniref:hypothetical protein n=1 Tax=unclassified Aurantimonas TaxID=2638230 RepID=UPI002E189537|nr:MULTISPECIES: hypothetical protein [unclassified Aurantimonas]MEC5291990.1 hypothetical protein [Aurantimonas sp. C2-3-R2]MEC5382102.1 hypothetical protein [Aurantimonas sp. C2-6-R+9]MEC5413075.1 hypothetical protein [Aurantimonas sp. C2-4-R8]
MDWHKISKAVGGGVAAAVGGIGTAAIAIPPEVVMPWFGYVIVGVANAGLGFVTVYWFPKNSANDRAI